MFLLQRNLFPMVLQSLALLTTTPVQESLQSRLTCFQSSSTLGLRCVQKSRHRVIKGFHKCRVVNWRLGSSKLACVASISVSEDVLTFVLLPVIELLGGVQVISVLGILSDIDQVFSLKVYGTVIVLHFIHSEIMGNENK